MITNQNSHLQMISKENSSVIVIIRLAYLKMPGPKVILLVEYEF